MSVLQAIRIQHVTIKMYVYIYTTYIHSFLPVRCLSRGAIYNTRPAAITKQSSSSLTQFLRVKFFIPFLHPPSKSPQTTHSHTRIYFQSLTLHNWKKRKETDLSSLLLLLPFFAGRARLLWLFCRLPNSCHLSIYHFSLSQTDVYLLLSPL